LRIEGLTEEQCRILDKMWVADTVEELYDFFKSLSEEEYNMAIVLQELLIQEISEEESKNLKLAQNMLNNIGVKI
jgi:hypothetical protein